MEVKIIDVRSHNYIYHSTPKPTALVCLIAGYHKAQGDSVVLSDVPVQGCINYVVSDDRFNEDYMVPCLFAVENTFCVGRAFANGYYNPEWEKYPPDLTIYHNFYNNWINKYPKYNAMRLTSYTLTPFLIRRNGECFSPPPNALVLDTNIDIEIMQTIAESNSKNIIFANNPVITSLEHFEAMLQLYGTKKIRSGDCKIEIDWSEEFKNNMDDYIALWNKYRCGRMLVIRLRIDASKASRQDKIDIYNAMGKWRMEAGKRLGAYPANISDDYRFWTELKRWSNSRSGYGKNSLVDYILYDGCRDVDDIARFLYNPYIYTSGRAMGNNKVWWVIDLFESKDEELIRTFTTSYNRGGN